MGDLTQLATVKAELGLTDTSLDSWLETVIGQESARIEAYCRRSFEQRSVTDTFRQDTRERRIVLSVVPVVSVASVTEDGETLASSAYELDAAAGFLDRLDDGDNPTTWAAAKIVVTYTAGYLLPGDASRDLPADIEAACIELVRLRYFARDRDPAVRSESVDGVFNASYRDALPGGMPGYVMDTLAPWRNMVIA